MPVQAQCLPVSQRCHAGAVRQSGFDLALAQPKSGPWGCTPAGIFLRVAEHVLQLRAPWGKGPLHVLALKAGEQKVYACSSADAEGQIGEPSKYSMQT